MSGGGSAEFDPAKCDHGAELHGTSEWSWCENCDRERFAREMCSATMFDKEPKAAAPPWIKWPMPPREPCKNCEGEGCNECL